MSRRYKKGYEDGVAAERARIIRLLEEKSMEWLKEAERLEGDPNASYEEVMDCYSSKTTLLAACWDITHAHEPQPVKIRI